MCEMGVLYGWKYMAEKLLDLGAKLMHEKELPAEDVLKALVSEIKRIKEKKNYAHYFDIRTNHLNEKDWRRSFSINQMLYGMVLYATTDGQLHNHFDEIIPILQKEYGNDLNFESDWR